LLLAFGVLVLLFVAYLLWGTGIFEASHQNALRHQFEQELGRTTGKSSSSTTQPNTQGSSPNSPPQGCTSSGQTTSTTLAGSGAHSLVPGTVPAEGQPVGIIQIPKISLDKVVVEGTGTSDLRLGPGHYPGTPLPGQPGNAAIAGHRTTYGAPFYDLNEMATGDPIYVTTTQGCFTYDVTQVRVVSPNDTSVVAAIDPTSTPELTLTTCNPRFSSSQRLVVQATLSPTVTPAVIPPATRQTPPSKRRASSSGLAGDQGTWTGAFVWGAASLLCAVGVWLIARSRRRRLGAYALGVLPLLVLLFLFFENLSPLLPASF